MSLTRQQFHELYADPTEIRVGDMATSLRKCAIFSLYCHIRLKLDNPEGLQSDLKRIANTVSCTEEEILRHFQEYCG